MTGYVLFGFDDGKQFGGAMDLITYFENIKDIDFSSGYINHDIIQLLDLSSGQLKCCKFKNIIEEYEEINGKIEKEETFVNLLMDKIKELIK